LNIPNSAGGLGQFTGTFIADATTQDITLNPVGLGGAQFNAYQLRDPRALGAGPGRFWDLLHGAALVETGKSL
jgi:hypothetical protein